MSLKPGIKQQVRVIYNVIYIMAKGLPWSISGKYQLRSPLHLNGENIGKNMSNNQCNLQKMGKWTEDFCKCPLSKVDQGLCKNDMHSSIK